MPSGAKKRKQAKKKKEQQAHSNSNNSSSISDSHSQGNDDPKSQDERDSDGGELGSPASLDHQNQHHPFNEENEESEKPVRSSFVTKDVEGIQNNLVENVVEIQREVNLKQDIGSIDVNVEHIEFSKAAHNGDDKSSSSSSSDDESQAFDEKRKVESHYSAPDAISCDNVEKVEEVKEDSKIEKQVIEVNGNSVLETAPSMDCATAVAPMSELAKNVAEGVQSENVEVSEVVESEFKENEDKLLPTSDVVAIPVPEQNEENVFPQLNQNAGASTTVSASKDFEASENFETQPLVPPAPRIAQRTSVLSCCGLFDVFTGSNR